MLDDALRDMAAFAARGRVGAARPAQPRLQIEVPQRIVRGAPANIAWQAWHVRDVHLAVAVPGRHPVQLRVPARGQRPLRDLPVGRTEVRLVAVPLRDHAGRGLIERQAFIEVVHPEPNIEFNAVRRIVHGAPLRISWRVQDAARVELLTPAGAHEVVAEGGQDFPLLDCGRHRFCIHADGPGGHAERAITVQVVAPPIEFGLPEHISVEQGADAAIRYAIRGAARLLLSPIDRDEPARLIPMTGTIYADGVMESERFVFTATGHDGRVRSQTTALRVGPTPPPDISDFLEILQRRM